MNGTQFLKGLAIILVGVILLLNNFNILEWSVWYNIFKLWPLLLVSLGISLIFRRRLSWLAPMVIVVGIIIGVGAGYMGVDLSLEGTISTEVTTLQREIELVPVTKTVEQEAKEDVSESEEIITEADTETLDKEDEEITTDKAEEIAEEAKVETEMLPNVQKANLHLSYDVGVFNLESPTPLVYQCQVSYRYPNFEPIEDYSVSEQIANIHIYHDSLSSSDNHFRNPKNEIDLKLNKEIIYDLLIETGATTINYDLSKFKVEQFSVKSGASDIKIITPQYNSDININSGVSKIDINIPENIGAIINLDTGLSSKDFGEEFKKEEGNKYISDNYNNSEYKVNINIDSGLSQISIHYL
jgi:hypothetical protein